MSASRTSNSVNKRRSSNYCEDQYDELLAPPSVPNRPNDSEEPSGLQTNLNDAGLDDSDNNKTQQHLDKDQDTEKEVSQENVKEATTPTVIPTITLGVSNISTEPPPTKTEIFNGLVSHTTTTSTGKAKEGGSRALNYNRRTVQQLEKDSFPVQPTQPSSSSASEENNKNFTETVTTTTESNEHKREEDQRPGKILQPKERQKQPLRLIEERRSQSSLANATAGIPTGTSDVAVPNVDCNGGTTDISSASTDTAHLNSTVVHENSTAATTSGAVILSARLVGDVDDDTTNRGRNNNVTEDQLQQLEVRLRAEFHQESRQLIQQTQQAILSNAVQAQVIRPDEETGHRLYDNVPCEHERVQDRYIASNLAHERDFNNSETTGWKATAVSSGEYGDEQSSDQREGNGGDNNNKGRRFLFGIVCFVICVAVIAIVIAVAVSPKGNDDSTKNDNPANTLPEDDDDTRTASPTLSPILTSSPTSGPSPTETPAPVAPSTPVEFTPRQQWEEFIISYRVTDRETLLAGTTGNTASPQGQALDWLVEQGLVAPPTLSSSPASTPPSPVIRKTIQLYVIVAFYFATHGPTAWKNDYGYLTPIASAESAPLSTNVTNEFNESTVDMYDVCSWSANGVGGDWRGIRCNHAGLVEGIVFWDNGLQGSLISELGQLTYLQEINLPLNEISGTLQFGNDDDVQEVSERTGPTLSHWSSLTQMRDVHLQQNLFTGTIPLSLTSLPRVESIRLWQNYLSGTIPSFAANSGTLRVVRLNYNSGIQGGSLEDFFNSVPLTLEQFSCRECGLHGTMPSRLGAFTELQQLELDHNDITGTIPSEIGGDGNMMLGLMSLSQLEIHDNGIWGTIPTQVGLLTNLVELQMHDNYLSGTIPNELGNVTKLENVRIHNNLLDGTIPQKVADLPLMETLNLGRNELTGIIPTFHNNENALRFLSLNWNNDLMGNADELFPSLPSTLRTIWCGGCNFLQANVSNIDFSRFPDLDTLYLAHGMFVGTLPDTIGQLTSMVWINFAVGGLTGTIPSNIALLPNLQNLELANNDLTGTVPNFSGNPGTLRNLHLRGNSLSGRLDELLLTLPPESLEEINLGFNDMSGSIPTEIGNFIQLDEMVLDGNGVTGTLPTEFGLLTKLTDLRAQANSLSGKIPLEFAQLTMLQSLQMHNNDLTGLSPNEELYCNAVATASSVSISFITDCAEPVQVPCSCCTECWSDEGNEILD